MGLDEANLMDDGDGGGDKTVSSVSCSICLEVVAGDGERSWAKLHCGHEFHLDCIGSAFNIKGAMQCPNCRKVEKGQWLYSNNCRPFPEFSMDDWAHDEDLYDLNYSEMSFGVHWCPFGGLARLPSSSFDEGDFSSSAYHELIGQNAIFPDHSAVSSASHPCPYLAYFGPIQPSSSNPNRSVSDVSNYNGLWGGPSVPSEVSTSFAFPAVDAHYHNWDRHSSAFPTSSRINAADQSSLSAIQRIVRANSEATRSGSHVHPPFLLGHGSVARPGSSVASSMIPPYPGSVARARDRVQALQAYFQQSSNLPALRTPIISSSRRSTNHRGLAQVGPLAASSEQNGFYFFAPGSSGRTMQEPENALPGRFNVWEREHLPSVALNQVDRDPTWVAYHHASSGSNSGGRSGSLRQRHGSERMASQNRS